MSTGTTTTTKAPWSITLAGWLLLWVVIAAVLAVIVPGFSAAIAGGLIWLVAALLKGGGIKGAQRIQVIVMFTVGGLGLVGGLVNGADSRHLLRALEANQMVIAMLIGVSFLRLVTAGELNASDRLPTGRKALLSTLAGPHLFGSVINMSALFIVGDRLSRRQPLSTLQALIMSRAFSLCAHWSPFFAAMGVALVSAPGAQLSTLAMVGAPLSLLMLVYVYWELNRAPDAAQLTGYPLNLRSLWLPFLLAVLVMVSHQVWPDVPVLTLVTLIAVLVALTWSVLREGVRGVYNSIQHVQTALPRQGNEVMLFLGAAVLGAGVAALLDSFDIQLSFAFFGANQAFVVLLIMVTLAMIGMHPVTSVTLVGSLLAPVVDDPNLLALVFLMTWAFGAGLSPFSGLQLSLISRYQVDAMSMLRRNWRYGLVLLAMDYLALQLYGWASQ
ncbi:MAG: hypothetical protein LAT65_12165 [Saccharospirillum sp.]|nr:hypothetical protein [Saccharospirillum sp.]